MRPIRQSTDSSQYSGLQQRLDRLERNSGYSIDVPSSAPVSSIDLGSVDGENITGLRIVGAGIATSGAGFIRLRPNGLNPMNTNAIGHQVYTGGSPTYTPTEAVVFGGAVGSGSGMVVASLTDFGITSQNLSFNGVLTTRSGALRVYSGIYTSIPNVTDSNLMATMRLSSRWHDGTTAITSLVLALDGGTFSGRVSVEVIP